MTHCNRTPSTESLTTFAKSGWILYYELAENWKLNIVFRLWTSGENWKTGRLRLAASSDLFLDTTIGSGAISAAAQIHNQKRLA